MKFVGLMLGVVFLSALASQVSAVKVEIGQPTPTVAVTEQSNAPLPLSVKYQPISKNPMIGEPFMVRVVFDIGQEVELEPVVYQDQLGDWEVMNIEKGEVNCNGKKCQRIDNLTLVTYLPGQIVLPSIPFGFTTKEKQGEYRPLPITIKVDGLPPKADDEPGKIRGLKPPQGMLSWWLVAIISFGLLAIASGLWWWLKQRGLLNYLTKSEPIIPPEIIAKDRLNKLRSGQLIDQGQNKLYYSALTDILRRYLEARYAIHAVDRTTHELAKNLKQTDCLRPDILKITDLMEFSDLVKFAKAGADQQEADQHWQLVWDFVEKTTPQETKEEAEPTTLESTVKKSS